MAQILVVDDEIGIRELLSEILADEGHDVRLAENAATARKAREAARPDLVLLDIWMPDMDGVSLLREWSVNGLLSMPVVMMSGHGTIDTAVEATRIGAVDFLEKPIALQKLLATVKKALKQDKPVVRTPPNLGRFSAIPSLNELRRRLEQASQKVRVLHLSQAQRPVSEWLARTLQGAGQPWLDFSTLNEVLSQDKLESLSGGVLFVPELAQLGKSQQMSLAFALERVERFRFHLVTASEHPCIDILRRGESTETGPCAWLAQWDTSLLQRLCEVWIDLPDIHSLKAHWPVLVDILLALLAEQGVFPPRQLSEEASQFLRERGHFSDWNDWITVTRNLGLQALDQLVLPRDLENFFLGRSPKQLPSQAWDEFLALPLKEARDLFERHYLQIQMEREGGNMTRLAERSGLERTHLYRKLRQLGLSSPRGQGQGQGKTHDASPVEAE